MWVLYSGFLLSEPYLFVCDFWYHMAAARKNMLVAKFKVLSRIVVLPTIGEPVEKQILVA